jgi:hypothetical protein
MLSSPVYTKLKPCPVISRPRLAGLSSSDPRHFGISTFRRSVAPSSNSLRYTLLAPPHPLTPFLSHSYKNHRGEVHLASPLCPHNSFKCNTYGPPHKCCKQTTYGSANSFRCNTYDKDGGARSVLPLHTLCLGVTRSSSSFNLQVWSVDLLCAARPRHSSPNRGHTSHARHRSAMIRKKLKTNDL